MVHLISEDTLESPGTLKGAPDQVLSPGNGTRYQEQSPL